MIECVPNSIGKWIKEKHLKLLVISFISSQLKMFCCYACLQNIRLQKTKTVSRHMTPNDVVLMATMMTTLPLNTEQEKTIHTFIYKYVVVVAAAMSHEIVNFEKCNIIC